MGERWVVGADDREGTGLDGHSPARTPGHPSSGSAGPPGQPPSLPFSPGRFEGGGLGDMREGGREGGLVAAELSGQTFNGEPGPQGSGTPAPGLGTFFLLLNPVCLSDPKPLFTPIPPRNLWVWSHSKCLSR